MKWMKKCLKLSTEKFQTFKWFSPETSKKKKEVETMRDKLNITRTQIENFV